MLISQGLRRSKVEAATRSLALTQQCEPELPVKPTNPLQHIRRAQHMIAQLRSLPQTQHILNEIQVLETLISRLRHQGGRHEQNRRTDRLDDIQS